MPSRTVAPSALTSSGAIAPRRLRVQPERASAYASRLDMRLVGADLGIESFQPLSALEDSCVTYLSSRRFARALAGRIGVTVVTTVDLLDAVPDGNSVLITTDHSRNAFYSIMGSALALGFFESLESYISPHAKIAASAVISSNVFIEEGAEIGAGVVLLPNTYVGKDVRVKPNAVIGGDGFEATIGDDRRIVTHTGGVWLATGAQVGSCTCIDKGLFGDFTTVGNHTLIDNLVHFAHSARTGRGCSIIAGAEVSGSVALGDGVWVGPNAAINQGIKIAEHCYIGTGAVVTRDLAAHSLAYGSPAKRTAWVCDCRVKLTFDGGLAQCECGKRFSLTDDQVRQA